MNERVREKKREERRKLEIFFAKMRRRVGEIMVFMDLDQIEDLSKLIRVPKYVRSKSIDVDFKFIAGHKLIFWPPLEIRGLEFSCAQPMVGKK